MKDFQFGYDFKESLIKHVPWVAKATIALSGQNLFTISETTKLQGFESRKFIRTTLWISERKSLCNKFEFRILNKEKDMINKYIRILYVGLAITGITTSCDVMDTKPFESYNEETVWENEETIEAFIMKSYNGTITHFTGNSASWEALTPNGCRCDQYDNSIDNTATETGIDSYSDYGFGRSVNNGSVT